MYIMNYKQIFLFSKVHRILKFNQSPWLAKYINLNTTMRKNAKNDFEKNFFKLMNNAVFGMIILFIYLFFQLIRCYFTGKTMENVRNRMKMELVSDEKKCAKLINKINFQSMTRYHDNLAAIHLQTVELKFNKPIYVGFSILDISKTLMYDFHYGSMKQHFNENIELMYMDTGNKKIIIIIKRMSYYKENYVTDSLIYDVKNHDVYEEFKQNHNLFKRMDTSNLPVDHPCYCAERKKIPGTFTDETAGKYIWEFLALRSKSYAYNLAGEENIKAKGIQGHVVKNHMTLDDHKKCLFWKGAMPKTDEARDKAVKQANKFETTGSNSTEYTPFRVNKCLRSFKHQMKTISTVKLALNRHDDKRFVMSDNIHTLAHGHYKIEYVLIIIYLYNTVYIHVSH